jgi:hypothetical protein
LDTSITGFDRELRLKDGEKESSPKPPAQEPTEEALSSGDTPAKATPFARILSASPEVRSLEEELAPFPGLIQIPWIGSPVEKPPPRELAPFSGLTQIPWVGSSVEKPRPDSSQPIMHEYSIPLRHFSPCHNC